MHNLKKINVLLRNLPTIIVAITRTSTRKPYHYVHVTWWGNLMETFSALLALFGENPPVTGGFPSQRPVTRSFDVFLYVFYLRLNKRLSKHSGRWWFETPSRSLWRHCNDSNWLEDLVPVVPSLYTLYSNARNIPVKGQRWTLKLVHLPVLRDKICEWIAHSHMEIEYSRRMVDWERTTQANDSRN